MVYRVFANFSTAMAEGRAKAQAAILKRRVKTLSQEADASPNTGANTPLFRSICEKEMWCWCAGDTIPMDAK